MRCLIFLIACAHPAVAGTNNDDLAQRRSIRGRPVEVVRESESLRQVREFEESAFPTPNPLAPDFDRAVPPPPLEAPEPSPSWLREVKLPDFPVRWDPRVVRYLEFYKNDKRGHAIMAGWLRAQGRWKALFEDALGKAHLPLGL